ncbi:unnamed protein product [Rhodiola kirilowii]
MTTTHFQGPIAREFSRPPASVCPLFLSSALRSFIMSDKFIWPLSLTSSVALCWSLPFSENKNGSIFWSRRTCCFKMPLIRYLERVIVRREYCIKKL